PLPLPAGAAGPHPRHHHVHRADVLAAHRQLVAALRLDVHRAGDLLQLQPPPQRDGQAAGRGQGVRLAAAARLLAAALTSGCTSSPAWGMDRLRDLTDIVDVRYGTGLGLGVQADALLLLGTGVGWSDVSYSRVWYGRHSVDTGRRTFLGLLLYSSFGDYE